VTGVLISGGGLDFSPCHHVQTGSGAHSAPYPVGTRGSFSQG